MGHDRVQAFSLTRRRRHQLCHKGIRRLLQQFSSRADLQKMPSRAQHRNAIPQHDGGTGGFGLGVAWGCLGLLGVVFFYNENATRRFPPGRRNWGLGMFWDWGSSELFFLEKRRNAIPARTGELGFRFLFFLDLRCVFF